MPVVRIIVFITSICRIDVYLSTAFQIKIVKNMNNLIVVIQVAVTKTAQGIRATLRQPVVSLRFCQKSYRPPVIIYAFSRHTAVMM